ncbi:MAG: response regulator, partial [Cyclobacteriaceae bacterium]
MVKRERVRSQYQLEKVTAEKIHEIDQLKINFFINITHELMTPLTLILGHVEDVQKKLRENILVEKMEIVQSNAKRLYSLFNQLLDIRKMETGKVKPALVKNDLNNFLYKKLVSFVSLAERTGIKLEIQNHVPRTMFFFDPDKLEKILSNLISNAFKYTRPTGNISVYFDLIKEDGLTSEREKLKDEMLLVTNESLNNVKGDLLKFIISDTGEGISPGEMEAIFQSFYQSQNKNYMNFFGVGLGLSLTRELINILKAELYIESSKEGGTKFVGLVPASTSFYGPGEYLEMNGELNTRDTGLQVELPPSLPTVDLKISSNETFYKKSKLINSILIVEDNQELLEYTKEILGKSYKVITANNGKEAFDIVIKGKVDIVISDIMMPIMDGIELCNKIKNDDRTSHVPLILLTAKRNPESELEGLEQGADDYIMKPFNADALLMRVNNILESRVRLREMFSKDLEFIPEAAHLTKEDDAFLKKIIKLVEDNISDFDYDKEKFFNELGVSRTKAYKKLNYLTNQTVNEFIRTIRLKKAAEILKSGKSISVADLAYSIGFSSQGYFTRMFKNYFGMTPSQ